MTIYLGLMSGTSADGVTAALVDISKGKLKVLSHRTLVYPPKLRARVLAAAALEAPALARLNVELGEFFSKAGKALLSRHRGGRIAAVGSHGQTVWHGPGGQFPTTFQIGEPAVIAERLGLTVVADFRPRDLAAGGQGAPLVPFFDRFLFGSGPARAVQNIGGIANVSVVGRGVKLSGFDTGPGNCLIDLAAARASGGRLAFDKDGRLAKLGWVRAGAAKRLLKVSYFSARPPKSADRGAFGPAFLKSFGLRGADLVATATYFTALTIADQYRRYVPKSVRECVVSGGGTKNPVLMAHLRLLLPMKVRTIDEFGIPSEAKEAACFALLAERAVSGHPNNCPEATGARGPRILGKIVPA